jgi:hypothetical protein
MHDPALRSRFAALSSTPGVVPSAALPSSSEPTGEPLEVDAVLSLSGLAIAAVATIVAFFGIGYLLFAGTSAPITRSEPAAAVVAKGPSAAAIAPTEGAPAVPTNPAAPSPSPDGERAAVPIAPAGNMPVVMPAETAAPDNAGPVSPAPSRDVRADSAPATATSAPSANVSSRPGDAAERTTVPPVPGAQLPSVEINALLMQGDDAFRNGDLASARLLYRRVYDANDGRGALGIGASYDPVFLRRYHLWTRYANSEEARIWYLRAHDLGAQDAQTRLKRLNVKSAR